jgi:uncharacterized membrane protein YqiK
MFTIPTLPKILLIILIVGVVWWWHRRNQIRARENEELERNSRGAPRTRAKSKPAKPIEDMAQCKVCGAYVPASGARNCGRANCPY